MAIATDVDSPKSSGTVTAGVPHAELVGRIRRSSEPPETLVFGDWRKTGTPSGRLYRIPQSPGGLGEEWELSGSALATMANSAAGISIIIYSAGPTSLPEDVKRLNTNFEIVQGLTQLWVDRDWVDELETPTEVSDPAGEARTRERLDELERALKSEPIDDRYDHPAERVLEDMLRQYPAEAPNWIWKLYKERDDDPPVLVTLLQCVRRMLRQSVTAWGSRLAFRALKHTHVAVREAAVTMIETWGEPKLLQALRLHVQHEPTPWLKHYIEQVIADSHDEAGKGH